MNPHRIRQQFHRIAKSRLALSTVVTTLIILVVAVLLAGVVTYFAINVTSTRVQEESLALTKQHVWYDFISGKAQAAIMVINAGGRDVVIDRLTVRGQECTWSKVFYATVSGSVSGDLFYNLTLVDGGKISVGGSDHVFEQASNDLTVQSGKTLIIYMTNPDSISVNDIGLTVSVNIFTSQAMYYKETNVQGTGGTTQVTSEEEIPEQTVQQCVVYKAANAQVGMVIHNTGATAMTVHDPMVNHDYTGYLWAVAGAFTISGSLDYVTITDQSRDDGLLVQGHTLVYSTTGCTIPAGQTAIIYFRFDSSSLIVGAQVDVEFPVTGGTALIQTATVQSGPA